MHTDQVDVAVDTVRRLVADQFPQWRTLPVHPVASDGTVNALFRLGAEVVLRFPLRPGSDVRDALVREQEYARLVSAHVPLEVPTPIALGEPGHGYPSAWAAYRWIPGTPVAGAKVHDLDGLARDLAGFVGAFHDVPTGGRRWDGTGRGGPLRHLDDDVRRALAESTQLTDTDRLGELWSHCLAAPPGPGPDVLIHADLMPGNLLVRDGRLSAVIDLGTVGVGDPAVDLMPAWNMLPTGARETFRRELNADDATWDRGRGWAIAQAIIALPYYVETNPGMAETARRTLAALLG
jgi:aminoglycoside phosphotransferase (APT) family kinase protein